MAPVVAALDGVSSAGAASDFDLAGFREDVDGLEKAFYAFHHAAFDEEDRLITKPLQDFESSLHLAFAGGALDVRISNAG